MTSVKVPSWLLWKRWLVGFSLGLRVAVDSGAVDEEDVGPAVAVVVEDGYAGAGGLDDVALGVDAAVDVANQDAGFGGDVNEPCWWWVIGGGRIGLLG